MHQHFILQTYNQMRQEPLKTFIMNASKPRTFRKRKSPTRDEPADKVQKQEVNIGKIFN